MTFDLLSCRLGDGVACSEDRVRTQGYHDNLRCRMQSSAGAQERLMMPSGGRSGSPSNGKLEQQISG